jgi:hypothetical protein
VKSKKAKPKNVYYLAGAIENDDGEFYLKQREKRVFWQYVDISTNRGF